MALTSELEEYQPVWQQLFETEKAKLLPIFATSLEAIHHVGSTAIHGMLAKPEIDILVVLKEDEDLQCHFPSIQALGYDARGEEPGAPGHWYFSKNQNGRRTHKLHMCGPRHPCIQDQLLFRNYLRADPERAEQYRRLKILLSETNSKGMLEYLNGKAPFIQETLELAKKGVMGTGSLAP